MADSDESARKKIAARKAELAEIQRQIARLKNELAAHGAKHDALGRELKETLRGKDSARTRRVAAAVKENQRQIERIGSEIRTLERRYRSR